MPVTRVYECDACQHRFSWLHLKSDEPRLTDCPQCEAASVESRPNGFNITTAKAKAVDATYKIAEESLGVTDMKDGTRQGDVAVMPPPAMQTAERETITRELKGMTAAPDVPEHLKAAVDGFWQTGAQMPSSGPSPMQVAAHGAAVARADPKGSMDPIGLLHESGKQGALPKNTVVGKTNLAGDVIGPVRV